MENSSSDLVNPHHYLQSLLIKSFDISKKIYEKTGFKSEFIESSALKINKTSSQLATLLDTSIDGAIVKVNATTKSISEKTNQSKQELFERAKNLSVVRSADNLGNLVLTQIEQQVDQLSRSICGKLSIALPSSDVSESQEADKKSLAQRASQLVYVLNYLGGQIVDKVLLQVQQVQVVQSALQNYALVEQKTQEVRATLQSFVDVLIGTVIQQNLIAPLFQSLNVKYVQTKEQVVVIIENIKKVDVSRLLSLAKDSYQSIRQASIGILNGDKLTLTFAQTFFTSSFSTIQKEIAQLLTDVAALKVRFIENSINLYKQCQIEFKEKRAARLNQKSSPAIKEKDVQVSEESEDNEKSTLL